MTHLSKAIPQKTQVLVTEPLGEKMDIFASTEKHSHIVAHVDANDSIRPEQIVSFYINMNKVYIFNTHKNGENFMI